MPSTAVALKTRAMPQLDTNNLVHVQCNLTTTKSVLASIQHTCIVHVYVHVYVHVF